MTQRFRDLAKQILEFTGQPPTARPVMGDEWKDRRQGMTLMLVVPLSENTHDVSKEL
jgi:hypothetical protein